MQSFFHADHVTGVFYFRPTLNALGSFANTELHYGFAYSRPFDLFASSMGQAVKRTPTAVYTGKAVKTPLFSGKAAMS